MTYQSGVRMVSVCMITYNHEAFIREAIEGVLMQQTSFPIELVIGEDFSTDRTRAICEDYAENHPEIIRLLPSEKNLGMMPNFIRTLQAGTGKYISLCEGDDYWTDPMKLQKQVAILENDPETGLCYTDVDFYYQETGKFARSVFENGIKKRYTDYLDFLINMGYLAPLTWVFRRDVFDTFELGEPTDGSFVMMLEFLRKSKVYYINEVTGVYRKHSNGISQRGSDYRSYQQWKGVFETQKMYISKYEVDEKSRIKILSQGYFMLLYEAVKFDDKEFIGEAELFFDSISVSFSEVNSYCQRILGLERSASFRLGYLILTPLRYMRNSLLDRCFGKLKNIASAK